VRGLGVALALLLALPRGAVAEPFDEKEVLCGEAKCGKMVIDTYESPALDPLFGVDGVGEALISGKFESARPLDFHYIQAITRTTVDVFRWFNDTSVPLPSPFIDQAPGGFKSEDGVRTGKYTTEQPFDYLPWYDREGFPSSGNFPNFFDAPRLPLLYAKGAPDGTATFSFETWLVCVIDASIVDNEMARDDRYTVAPLLGWRWGYDIVYKDVGVIGVDELDDFTVRKQAFAFTGTPSADWTKALAARYGARPNQDFWTIATGSCTDCRTVPAPAALLLLLGGLLLNGLAVWMATEPRVGRGL
jgi:hypothetical protein